MSVIVLFEMIDIKEQQANGVPEPLTRCNFNREPFFEIPHIKQVGQTITNRRLNDLGVQYSIFKSCGDRLNVSINQRQSLSWKLREQDGGGEAG